jgi:nitrate/nitrite transport system permease protein
MVWHLATLPKDGVQQGPDERRVCRDDGHGCGRAQGRRARPGRSRWGDLGKLSDPFYDNGPNDKGIGIQLGYSLARVLAGFSWRRWWRCRWASSSACRR